MLTGAVRLTQAGLHCKMCNDCDCLPQPAAFCSALTACLAPAPHTSACHAHTNMCQLTLNTCFADAKNCLRWATINLNSFQLPFTMSSAGQKLSLTNVYASTSQIASVKQLCRPALTQMNGEWIAQSFVVGWGLSLLPQVIMSAGYPKSVLDLSYVVLQGWRLEQAGAEDAVRSGTLQAAGAEPKGHLCLAAAAPAAGTAGCRQHF